MERMRGDLLYPGKSRTSEDGEKWFQFGGDLSHRQPTGLSASPEVKGPQLLPIRAPLPTPAPRPPRRGSRTRAGNKTRTGRVRLPCSLAPLRTEPAAFLGLRVPGIRHGGAFLPVLRAGPDHPQNVRVINAQGCTDTRVGSASRTRGPSHGGQSPRSLLPRPGRIEAQSQQMTGSGQGDGSQAEESPESSRTKEKSPGRCLDAGMASGHRPLGRSRKMLRCGPISRTTTSLTTPPSRQEVAVRSFHSLLTIFLPLDSRA